MRSRLTVTGDIHSRTRSIVINVHLEALAVGVSSDLLPKHLNQLGDSQHQLNAPQPMRIGPFGCDG
jgi:hypothetical protein